MTHPVSPRERLIVALDVTGRAKAEALVETLGDSVAFYKIGYQLALSGGLELARDLLGAGKQVFLDMKLHDIGNTVAKGVEGAAAMGVTFLTVHAYPQTLRAAVEGKRGSALKILGVTVLTSYDDGDLADAGYAKGVGELVAHRAAAARDIGADGLILSPEELAQMRAIVGAKMLLVTPGVRPAGSAAGDQKRVLTPARAVSLGADYLVVGRPVLQAENPRAAADAIVAEIAQAAGRAAA